MFSTFSLRDTDNIRNFRLSPSELNMVLHQIALNYDSQSDPKVNRNNVADFHLVIAHNIKYYICPMSKDAETTDNEKGTPYIWDTIKRFKEEKQDSNCILLIPMRLCRGYFGLPTSLYMLKRKHAVLLVADLVKNKIDIHDSQGWMKQYCYPDKINQLSENEKFQYDYSRDYHAHNIQEDVYSCGYFVKEFIESILKTGDQSQCKDVKLNITKTYSNKTEYLSTFGINIESSENKNAIDVMDDELDALLKGGKLN